MKLNLTRPLVVFDLETTGLDLVNDRIIQISYIKIYPDGKEERENLLVYPQRPIPDEVSELTGITTDLVEDAPTFDLHLALTRCSKAATSLALTPTISTFPCLPRSFCVPR